MSSFETTQSPTARQSDDVATVRQVLIAWVLAILARLAPARTRSREHLEARLTRDGFMPVYAPGRQTSAGTRMHVYRNPAYGSAGLFCAEAREGRVRTREYKRILSDVRKLKRNHRP